MPKGRWIKRPEGTTNPQKCRGLTNPRICTGMRGKVCEGVIDPKEGTTDPKVCERMICEGMLFETTLGRLMFNDILPQGMPYYNEPLKAGGLQMVISNCFEYCGRRATIDLLDRMMRIGFEESTKSGLSFATDDLITPNAKAAIIKSAEKDVAKAQREYMNGAMTDNERYNKVLDAWTRAREEITKQMMVELENDTRAIGYVNPIFLMANSGARGGVEQIRQLAGMRGLMSKPNGNIIEAPIMYSRCALATSFSADLIIAALAFGVIRSSVANDKPLLVLSSNPMRIMRSSKSIVARRPLYSKQSLMTVCKPPLLNGSL
jgi:DNA-directed RNA polymerase beta' subunit